MTTFPALTKQSWDKGMSGYGGTAMDGQTRTAWKYACSRGVTGTPIFFVNGVPVEANAEWTVKQWVNLIDPLLHANEEPSNVKRQNVSSSSSLTSSNLERSVVAQRPWFHMNQKNADLWHCSTSSEDLHACEFEENKTMCCLSHEWCIPEQGCMVAFNPDL